MNNFRNMKEPNLLKLKYEEAYSFSDGLALVKQGGKFGFIDITGKEIVVPIYDTIRNFKEGMIAVGIKKQVAEDICVIRWGLIDKNKKVVVPLIYDEVTDFSEGLAVVKLDDSWGYVQIDGTVKEWSINK